MVGDGFLPLAEGLEAALALNFAVGDLDRNGRLGSFRSVADVEALETLDDEVRHGNVAARRKTRFHATVRGPSRLLEFVRHDSR